MKLKICTIILILFTSLSCVSIRQSQTNVIKIKGSNTMLILGREWAAGYMAAHPGISVYVEGGGSSTGITSLLDGTIDIAMTSRLIRTEEAQELAKKYNSIGLSFLTAKDALSVFLNPENPITDLSVLQLKEIFSGKIRNWRQVGGLDEPIEVIIRPPTSGTHTYFKEYILENVEYSPEALILPTTGAVVEQTQKSRKAIGYGGIAYGINVTHCNINGIAAQEENVHNNTYPLSRYLYLYTINTPTGLTREFIDWVMSPAGQKIVDHVGYIPIWPLPE